MKPKILPYFFYICLFLCFLPKFVIFIIPKTSANFVIAAIACMMFYIVSLIYYQKNYLLFINRILKLPLLKYYLLFIIIAFLTTLGHMFLGFYTAPAYFYLTRIINYFIAFIVIYFLPINALFCHIKYKNIRRFFIIAICTIMYIGFIQYFAFLFNINIISSIIDFFSNWRLIREIDSCAEALRVYSIFDEPAAFAQFIFITMPFIIDLSLSKYKLLTNNVLNKLVKKTIIPCTLSCIVFTKSPIYLILCFIEFALLLGLHYKNFIKRHILKIIILFSTFIIIVIQFLLINLDSISETYLNRIILTCQALGSLSALSVVEPSLATRITSYAAQLIIFKKNLLFGVGLANAEPYVNSFFLKIPYPITIELYYKYYKIKYAMTLNYSLIWTSLAEIGLIGTFSYIYFMYKNYVQLKIINRFLSGVDYIFVNCMAKSIIAIFILSFYNLWPQNISIWLIFGIALLIIANFSTKVNNGKKS